ncbi:MAG: multicopper oxidase family protein [Minwuia sp.]|nr:multicopper oxidase family protein [Minwuia sp.]
MLYANSVALSRRKLLSVLMTSMGMGLMPASLGAAPRNRPVREFHLRAAANRAVPDARLSGPTDVWTYNNSVPGPELRVRQGDRVRVRVTNGLAEPTTVHWHGVRVPNAMDGVPHVTQAPIPPDGNFVYEFDAVDAGTYWYHPHYRSYEQVGRGLYGPLIVEEPDPVRADRDLTWILDDWRLGPDGLIRDDFGNRHDMAHNGRVGNTVTINGRPPAGLSVRGGERIRLRLVNAANARIFSLDFEGHAPTIIALDGQPVSPHSPKDGLVLLGPAMRADIILDMHGEPGSRFAITDRFYRGLEYQLSEFNYASTPLRSEAPDWKMDLPPNPIPEPLTRGASRHEVVFNGGMMGRGMGAGNSGGMMNMMRRSGIWSVNGMSVEGHFMEPFLMLDRDRSHVISMTNATAWHHPIHLHGHSFRVLSRDGIPTRHQEWQDTVMMAPREKIDIALVADNPGDWMFHCHILEHQAAGMMGVIRVN